MRRRAYRTHLAGLLVLAALGWEGRGGQTPRLVVTDDANRAVSLAHPARRIVSLSPATTELLFALGAGDRVVGRTTWCDYPAEATLVPSVGDGLNPNIEAIAARRPDLVVLYRSTLDLRAAQQLLQLDIPALVLKQDRLEDLARAAQLISRLTDDTMAGDSIARVMLATARTPASALGISIAFVTWDNPPIVIGRDSYLDQLASLAGARNVFHDMAAASSIVSLETIAVRDPDILVTIADSAERHPEPPAYVRAPAWQAIRAVREHRFVVLGGSLFGHPSPRADSAVRELRQMLRGAR